MKTHAFGRLVLTHLWVAAATTGALVGLFVDVAYGAAVALVAAVAVAHLGRHRGDGPGATLAPLLLAAQAPIMAVLALKKLTAPLSPFWSAIEVKGVERLALALGPLVAAPILAFSATSIVAQLDPKWFVRLRAVALRALPWLGALSSLLFALAAARAVRFPPAADYMQSLSLVVELPAAAEQECAPMAPPAWATAHPGEARFECATAEVSAKALKLHYHCYQTQGPRQCSLMNRLTDAPEGRGMSLPEGAPVRVYWEERRGWYLIDVDGAPYVLGVGRWLTPPDIKGWIAPPLRWLVVAAVGLISALLLGGAAYAVGRLERASGRVQSTEARGDLAVAAVVALLFTSAPLVVALAMGMVV